MNVYDLPDKYGHFGPYGGVFVAETLIAALDELRIQYEHFRNDASFQAEFAYELKHYVGRPSPIYHAKRWSAHLGGAQILLKREVVMCKLEDQILQIGQYASCTFPLHGVAIANHIPQNLPRRVLIPHFLIRSGQI